MVDELSALLLSFMQYTLPSLFRQEHPYTLFTCSDKGLIGFYFH